jgi:glycosyltransferase involved in cell wall biosynthesis
VTATAPSAVYVLPAKLGGVASFVDTLLAHRRPDGWTHWAVLTDNRLDTDARLDGPMSGDGVRRVTCALPLENLHAVLRRLARAIPPGPGVLVANDWLELAMLAAHPVERAVLSVTHGDFDYYYDLARRHEPLIDCFVTYTRRVHDELRRRLPHRAEAIVNLPYGVRVPDAARAPARGPLRLLYVGRLDRSKGILDLPAIHRHLAASGVDAAWTIHGAGPDADLLRRAWPAGAPVRWSGPAPMERVLALYPEHDVLVMPSRAEGLPVALLEAMAAGVVPVVSDLASGIPEVVEPGVTGERPAVGDVAGFAAAIAGLALDRDRLEHMSRAARRTVVERFDIRERARDYQALYARWRDLRRPRPRGMAVPYGSRLDRPWLPNAPVYATRVVRRWLAGPVA